MINITVEAGLGGRCWFNVKGLYCLLSHIYLRYIRGKVRGGVDAVAEFWESSNTLQNTDRCTHSLAFSWVNLLVNSWIWTCRQTQGVTTRPEKAARCSFVFVTAAVNFFRCHCWCCHCCKSYCLACQKPVVGELKQTIGSYTRRLCWGHRHWRPTPVTESLEHWTQTTKGTPQLLVKGSLSTLKN